MKNVIFFWVLIGSAVAQVPTGSIAAVVRDPETVAAAKQMNNVFRVYRYTAEEVARARKAQFRKRNDETAMLAFGFLQASRAGSQEQSHVTGFDYVREHHQQRKGEGK